MPEPMHRERIQGQHARVTTIELFFDLVFVFAITQVSHSLLAHPTWEGALHAGLLLLAIWWAWIYTTWFTNWLDPEHPLVRLVLFALMGLGLMLSTSLSEAFDGRAIPFALAYVGIQIARTLFLTWAVRRDPTLHRNFVRVSAWFCLSALFWIAGAFAAESVRLPLWLAALAIEYAGPAVTFWTPGLGRAATTDWNVEGAHMAERCGLFIIICLGESILVTGATFAEASWDAATVAAFAAALLGSIAMWWIYFSAHADAASHAIAESADPGRIARTAYTYAHIPIVAGIIVAAAGDELALAHPLGRAEPAAVGMILGGPAFFLAGAIWFKHSVFAVIATSRVAGLVLLGLVALVSAELTPLALATSATAILAMVGAWETLLRIRAAEPAQARPATSHSAK